MKPAPIVLFVYNRPWHTRQTVEALKKNNLSTESIIYIFSDGPKNEKDKKNIYKVRRYIHLIKGFKEIKIIERKKNYGLAESIISGVTKVINKHGKIIVLEDDIITSPQFLKYINYLLDYYQKEKKIFSITGYNHPKKLMKIPRNYNYDIYFSPRAGSQIWATWKDRWNKVDWEVKDFQKFLKNKDLQERFNQGGEDMSDMLISQMQGKIDSWAIRWCYTHFKNNVYCIYPTKSYVNNIGHDGSGVHSGKSNKFQQNSLNNTEILKLPQTIELNKKIMKSFGKVYKRKPFRKIIFNLIKNTKGYKYYHKMGCNK